MKTSVPDATELVVGGSLRLRRSPACVGKLGEPTRDQPQLPHFSTISSHSQDSMHKWGCSDEMSFL